jgi:hypothetical protein
MAMDRRPTAGFAIKVPCTVQGAEAALFLNFCHHPGIGMPVDHRGREVAEDELHRGVGFLRIPIDVGTWRKIPASETTKLEYIVDIILCKAIIERMMNDSYCNANAEFRPHVFELAMKTLEQSLPTVKIQRQVKLVKSCRYKHATRDAGPPCEFQELKGAAYAEEAPPPAQAYPPAPKAPEPEGPLIAEVTKKKTKPVVKKGFLNKPGKGGELYGPDGSKEGVLPENAGDPMGWIPKKLRNTCKIVDCNNPEYAAAQQAQEQKTTQEDGFAKMFKGLDLGERPSVFGEDKLVKGDDKYSVDYSRFEELEDPADEPVKDDRNFYYDEKGNVVSLSPEKKPEKAAPAAKGANVLDGIDFDKEFAALEKTLAGGLPDMSEAEKAFGADMKGFLNKAAEKDKAREAAREQKAGGAAKADAREEPKYIVTRNETVQVVVTLPLVSSMKTVELDVAEATLRLASPEYLLECKLPCAVDANATSAKFKKSTRELVVTIPPK